eukprot:TRINITY_DN1818_c0_g1_i3.p1 TRINITY_DN1818_c0_g1~~TRINITY_DN1818_c0_g1_i3.p1  ORF type:complete len:276 (-),score=90.30 TRINITY_DN1818_c0_g1_i3:14-841(-)
MAPSDLIYVILVVLSLFIILGSLGMVWVYGKTEPVEQVDDQPQENLSRRDRRNRNMDRLRRRRDNNEEDTELEPEIVEPLIDPKIQKLSAKKLRKLQMKQQKAREREAREEMWREQREMEDRAIDKRRRQEEKEEEKERLLEEALEQKRLKREAEEQADYEKRKVLFTVEATGSVQEELDEFNENIEEFIEYLKTEKVTYLENLSVKYDMRTADVVERLQNLLEDNRISGIIDERGKFIYISKEEMLNVASFINRRGRVSIQEIARESNKLIDLK